MFHRHRPRRAAIIAAVAVHLAAQVWTCSAQAAAGPVDTWSIKQVPLVSNDVAYDAARDVILATISSVEPALGNEIVELDPETGALGRHVFLGSEPGPIALTDDGTTAYVGLRGVSRIVRLDLVTFTVHSSFSTTPDSFFGPRYVEDLEAVPGRNDVVVASLMKPGFSPRHEGVWVFDDGVALPDRTPGHTGANRIEFFDATTVYGYNNETTEFGFRRITISATGAVVAAAGPSPITGFGTDIELVGGLAYSTTGLVVVPSTHEALRSFAGRGLIEVTPADNRITFLSGTTISVYDTVTTMAVGSRSFAALTGTHRSLVASATGFAVASSSGVFLLGPQAGGPAVTLPPPPDSALGDIGVVTVPLQARDMVYDDVRNRLYVSVATGAPDWADQVVALNPETGQVLASVFVGSGPAPLAITDDRSLLYVGQRTIGRIATIDLATFAVTGSFTVGTPTSGLVAPEDIEVQPGSRTTLAVSLMASGSPRHAGVVVFQDGVRLPNTTPGHTGANRIEFSGPATLVGTNNETSGFAFFRMAVGPTGVSITSTTGYLLPGYGTEIDVSGGLVYASTGLVADPARAELIGRLPFDGAVEPVPAVDRVFQAWSGGLEEYDLGRLRPVAAWDFALGSVDPFALVATAEGLAAANTDRVTLMSPIELPPPPVVTSVNPTSGPTAGGNIVTITGTGLTGATAVNFGGTPAASLTLVSDTEIRAVAPGRGAGTVAVTVSNLGGTSALVPGGNYTYVAPPTTTTTTTTTAPPTTTTAPPSNPPPVVPGPQTDPRTGYWMVSADGTVYSFGDARGSGNASVGAAEAVDIEATHSKDGYWVVGSLGNVFAFGDASHYGGTPALERGETVTSLSTTASGRGYWLFSSKGRVFPYGDAQHYGDLRGMTLNGPVLDSIRTATGRGYYLVASDGGIFAFGDAEFLGSMGHTRLNAAVQSLVPDTDGRGYWLVASDGGIFAFDAPFYGSMGSTRLNRPITGMVRSRSGYLMIAEDGGIFAFGGAVFRGSLGANPPPRPITNVASM